MLPLDLKNYILAAIPDQIGTYTYNNGYSTAAFAVGNPPNDITVTGIEIIIPNFPHITSSSQHGDSWLHRCEKWDIYIINHSQDKAKWFTAIDRLMRYFPRCFGRDIPQSNPTKDLPMYVLTIKHSDGYSIIKSSHT